MSTTIHLNSSDVGLDNRPGAQLALLRQQKGYSIEFISGKLHLRTHLIDLLELDDYEKMPEPVFIKGYLRAYAKLLEVAPEPFIEIYNRHYGTERRVERALWQSRRRPQQAYRLETKIRWVTGGVACVVLLAVLSWWFKTQNDGWSDHAMMHEHPTLSQDMSLNDVKDELRG